MITYFTAFKEGIPMQNSRNYQGLIAVSVDDSLQNLMLVEAYCDTVDLKTKNFTNPLDALEYLKSHDVDIIFIDYMMPEMDGVDLIKRYREFNTTTPIIMITAVANDYDLQSSAHKAGATDFLTKPLNQVEFHVRVRNLLELRLAQIELKKRANTLQEEVDKATQHLQDREHETLNILGKTAEYKDPETASHIARVAHYSELLASCLKMSKKEREVIFYASPFHDIGKVGIPDSILLAERRLTHDEMGTMQTHTLIGHNLLKHSHSEFLREGATIALTHHEKFDGTGYPHKLAGDEIPISGRITAIADVFDALTSVRPYKKAWSFDDAISFIIEEKEKHFDPRLVALFIDNIEKVRYIYQQFED
jgi:putative two-component system response regulator